MALLPRWPRACAGCLANSPSVIYQEGDHPEFCPSCLVWLPAMIYFDAPEEGENWLDSYVDDWVYFSWDGRPFIEDVHPILTEQYLNEEAHLACYSF